MSSKNSLDKTQAEIIYKAFQKAVSSSPMPISDRERSIIERYYGFDGHFRHTLQEIAEDEKITRERVRQIKHYALQQIGAITDRPDNTVPRKVKRVASKAGKV